MPWKKIVTEDDNLPANPSAVVGGAAINGTATTYMRSDAAPALGPLTRNLDFGAFKGTNLAAPTAAADAATKTYVDGVAEGLDVKESVRAATTAAGTLSTSFANASVIDGVTLATGDRILIKDQAAGAENGIYTVNASGAPTRATDADSNAEVTTGMFTFVESGTANADTGWMLSTDGAIVLGTTALVFTQFSSAGVIQAGAGLTKTGNTLDVGAGTAITVAADTVSVAALGITDALVATANKDGTVGTPSMRTLGTGAQQAAAGNDGRLSDTRIPSNANGGTAWTFGDNEITGLRPKNYTTAALPAAPAVGSIAFDTTVNRPVVWVA